MTDKIRLVDIDAKTSIHIYAEVTPKGDIIFSGQDYGEAPEEIWGHLDYEYWLTVKACHKDQVLLALIEKLYAGNPLLISELKDFLESKGIPCEFFAYA